MENTPDPHNIHAEFLIHAGDHAKEWLRKFFNKSLLTCKLPMIWRRATFIAPTNQRMNQRVTGRFHYCAFHTRSWNAHPQPHLPRPTRIWSIAPALQRLEEEGQVGDVKALLVNEGQGNNVIDRIVD